MSSSKTIRLFPCSDFEFSAEDLLHLSTPFGCVVSVQKIAEWGRACGIVTYSDATDALMAMMELIDYKKFTVALQATEKERTVTNIGSESARSEPNFSQEGYFDDKTPWRLHQRVQQYPPAYSQSKYLRIYYLPRNFCERQKWLSLLPLSSTVVEMTLDTVLVMLPDLPTAMMVKKFFCGLNIGPRRLYVSHEDWFTIG